MSRYFIKSSQPTPLEKWENAVKAVPGNSSITKELDVEQKTFCASSFSGYPLLTVEFKTIEGVNDQVECQLLEDEELLSEERKNEVERRILQPILTAYCDHTCARICIASTFIKEDIKL